MDLLVTSGLAVKVTSVTVIESAVPDARKVVNAPVKAPNVANGHAKKEVLSTKRRKFRARGDGSDFQASRGSASPTAVTQSSPVIRETGPAEVSLQDAERDGT